MKFQIKSCMNYVLKIVMMLVIFSVVSCSDDKEKKEEIPLSKIDLLSSLSSFEIPISDAPPVTVAEIANSLYSSPSSPYGMGAVIDFVVNLDNTIDILWIGKDKIKHLIRVSLINKSVIKDFIIPTKANLGNFLGFDSLGEDKFVLGYSKDNSSGDKDAEAWYTAFDGNTGKEIFDTRIFGEISLAEIWSKGNPGQAGTSIVKYNAKDKVIAIYTAHTQRWDDNVRHQAGWLGFLDATTGKLLTKGSKNEVVGNTWFYSHNFDQRGMFSKEGKFYVLAHGDSFPRSLGFEKFSSIKGSEGGIEYHKIQNGASGNNTTNSNTGDLEELSDGNVAIVFSTSDARSNRDLKLVILDALQTSKPNINKESWVSSNKGPEYVGWGSKVVQLGDKILIGWNTFDGKKPLNSKFCLADIKGNLISSPTVLPAVVLYPTQSIKKTTDGNKAIFVSYNGEKKLIVNIISAQ
ncbi:hypothetical protein [uncultured Flavobacterium sp.]|jgi:hypothetical protein|uniref:hypothetical protein n=1 Tax=uncultured Flavobacterium sp. TaxID=165435 RepID=UPI00308192CB